MAAAAILNSSNQAFFDIIDVLLFKVATFLPNLVEIGQKCENGISFLKSKMAVVAILKNTLPVEPSFLNLNSQS